MCHHNEPHKGFCGFYLSRQTDANNKYVLKIRFSFSSFLISICLSSGTTEQATNVTESTGNSWEQSATY